MQDAIRLHRGQTQKLRQFRFFGALKFKLIRSNIKFARKRCIKCPKKPNYAPITLVDDELLDFELILNVKS